MTSDSSYFARRADEERRLAMASPDPKVRRIHLEMAARYAVAAGPDALLEDEVPLQAEQERRTA